MHLVVHVNYSVPCMMAKFWLVLVAANLQGKLCAGVDEARWLSPLWTSTNTPGLLGQVLYPTAGLFRSVLLIVVLLYCCCVPCTGSGRKNFEGYSTSHPSISRH